MNFPNILTMKGYGTIMPKVLVVDDSPFSRSIIAGALTEGGFEVVGEAGCLEEAVEEFRKVRPDLVTMDMVMPGVDGLECVRALRLEDPNLKVIVVSSMKDDDLVKEAKKLNVSGYVQKPIDADELLAAVKAAVTPDETFAQLDNLYLEVFKDAFSSGMTMVAKSATNFADQQIDEKNYTSQGVAVVMGIVGRYSGRMLFDLSLDSATQLTKTALRRDPKNNDEVLAMVAEFANIFGGNACSALNKKFKELRLRVTPPSIFHGGSPEITTPNIQKKAIYADTPYGRMYLNIGFKRGVESWT